MALGWYESHCEYYLLAFVKESNGLIWISALVGYRLLGISYYVSLLNF